MSETTKMYDLLHIAVGNARWMGGDPYTIVMNDRAWRDLTEELGVICPATYRDYDPKHVYMFASLPIVFIDGFPDEPDEPWFTIARAKPR